MGQGSNGLPNPRVEVALPKDRQNPTSVRSHVRAHKCEHTPSLYTLKSTPLKRMVSTSLMGLGGGGVLTPPLRRPQTLASSPDSLGPDVCLVLDVDPSRTLYTDLILGVPHSKLKLISVPNRVSPPRFSKPVESLQTQHTNSKHTAVYIFPPFFLSKELSIRTLSPSDDLSHCAKMD